MSWSLSQFSRELLGRLAGVGWADDGMPCTSAALILSGMPAASASVMMCWA